MNPCIKFFFFFLLFFEKLVGPDFDYSSRQLGLKNLLICPVPSICDFIYWTFESIFQFYDKD